jgi:hypothetical protein
MDAMEMREQAEKLQGFVDALGEKETAEEKNISKLLEIADETIKPVLKQRLEAIQEGKATGIQDVMDIVNESGYTLAHVVRSGFSKIRGSLLHRAKKAEETGEDSGDDEDEV